MYPPLVIYIYICIYVYIYITIFPLKEVLGVNGVLGPRARVKSFNLEPLTRARADPGTLSKEIELYIYV